jgi:hypothetical protein
MARTFKLTLDYKVSLYKVFHKDCGIVTDFDNLSDA